MRHGFEFAFRHVGVRAAHAYGGNGVAREIEDGRREAAVVRLGLLAIDGPSATTHPMQVFQELLLVRDGVGRVRLERESVERFFQLVCRKACEQAFPHR